MVAAIHHRLDLPDVTSNQGKSEVPIYSMFQISNIVGEASLENIRYETTSLHYEGEMADAAGTYNQVNVEEGHQLVDIMGVMNDINIALIVTSVIAVPLAALGPQGLVAAGVEEAKAQTAGRVMTGVVSASMSGAGIALAMTQGASGFVKRDNANTQGASSNINQRSKQMSSSMSHDIRTENQMFSVLSQLINNFKNAANAYKAK